MIGGNGGFGGWFRGHHCLFHYKRLSQGECDDEGFMGLRCVLSTLLGLTLNLEMLCASPVQLVFVASRDREGTEVSVGITRHWGAAAVNSSVW